jgi:hypothetical protein
VGHRDATERVAPPEICIGTLPATNENGADVDGDHSIEVGERVIIHDAADQNSSIVDKNAEAPEAIDGLCHGAFHRIGIGAVGLDRQCCPAGLFDLGDDRLRATFGRGVAEGDGRAIVRQPPDDGGANAARPAGDEGDLTDCRSGRCSAHGSGRQDHHHGQCRRRPLLLPPAKGPAGDRFSTVRITGPNCANVATSRVPCRLPS